jgi:DNA polymerase (family 10)
MDIDLERVFEKAVETGTAIEINSQPDRLDMRDADARLAGERGVRITVSTDAHIVSSLDYMRLGVGQARRAWLTKDQVVNTRPWSRVKAKK